MGIYSFSSKEKINRIELEKIKTLSIIISKMPNKFSVMQNLVFTSIFMSPASFEDMVNIDKFEDLEFTYGDFSEKDSKDYKYVYRNKGGLRYCLKNYKYFFEKNNDIIAIVELEEEEQMAFSQFIDKIKQVKCWTRDAYHNFNNNSITFVSEAIKILEPKYRPKDIFVKKANNYYTRKESFVPTEILNALKKISYSKEKKIIIHEKKEVEF